MASLKKENTVLTVPTLAFHIGAHGRESTYLNKLFSLNYEGLAASGTICPPNGRFRKARKMMLDQFGNNPITANDQEFLLDFLMDTDDYQRIVFSYDAFISSRKGALSRTDLYPPLTQKLTHLRNFFVGHNVHIILGIESLVSFPCTLFDTLEVPDALLLESNDYAGLNWTSVYRRIMNVFPHAQITVFLTENSTQTWPGIVGSLLGTIDVFDLKGIYGFPLDSVNEDCRRPMLQTLKRMRPSDLRRYQEVSESYFRTSGSRSAATEKFPLLNWSAATRSRLNESYEEDIELFRSLENVEVV